MHLPPLLLLLVLSSSFSHYVTLPQHPTAGCGVMTSSSYYWDCNDVSNDNRWDGTMPKGEYGDNIKQYFCTGNLDSVPLGSYCFYQNSRDPSCPPGFIEGSRRQHEESDDNQSGPRDGIVDDLPHRIEQGDSPTWYFCCGSGAPASNVSFDAIRHQLSSQFTLFQKGGSCQVIDGHDVTGAGWVEWDDEDSNNTNAASGTLPDGTYTSDVTRMLYCTYSISNLPAPATSVTLNTLGPNSAKISWTTESSAHVYRLHLYQGGSLVGSYDGVGVLTQTFAGLTAHTAYILWIYSGISTVAGPAYETVGRSFSFTTCAAGYTGLTCSPVCAPICSSHGHCTAPNTCTCDPGWGGSTCNQCGSGYFPSGESCAACPDCNHGSCDDGPSGTGLCICDPGYEGSTCPDLQIPLEQWLPPCVYAAFGVGCIALYLAGRRRNPNASNLLILISGISVVECATDAVFLSVVYRLPDKSIFYSSLFFTIFPMLLNVVLVALVFIREMKRQDGKGNFLVRHSGLVSVIAMLSMTNVSLLRLLDSKIFNLEVFSMNWDEGTHLKGKVFGLVSDVLDNIPQIIIQAFYLYQNGADAVGIASMVASSISLLFGMVHKLLLLLVLRFEPPSAKKGPFIDVSQEEARGGAYFALE